MNENREFKGIWFPAQLWTNTQMTLTAKVILLEIDSFCAHGKNKSCYATNKHFVPLVGRSEKTVAATISKLVADGYIQRKIMRNPAGEVIRRELYTDPTMWGGVIPIPADHQDAKNEGTPPPENEGTPPPENEGTPPLKNEGTPPLKNGKGNYTNINNNNNNTVVVALESLGINAKKAEVLAEKYAEAQITAAIAAAKAYTVNHQAQSLPALIVKAITEGWTAPTPSKSQGNGYDYNMDMMPSNEVLAYAEEWAE